MSETSTTGTPVIVFVPPDLEADDVTTWRDAMVTELGEAGVVGDSDRSDWAAVLDETAAMELPEPASAVMLLVSGSARPLFLWATLAQPAGTPIALGEAVLDTQLPAQEHAAAAELPEGTVHQGHRIGRMAAGDGVDVFIQVTVTVATLPVEGLGDVDVCLWFGTDDLEAVDDLLPVVANLMHDPDLAAFLAA